MNTYEHEFAIMEAERNAAADEYFAARPQIDSIDRRRSFEAGFKFAWEWKRKNEDRKLMTPNVKLRGE